MPGYREIVTRLAVVVLILAGIWWPEWSHYRAATPGYSAELVNALRSSPGDAVLTRLARIAYEPAVQVIDPSTIIASAEDILHGKWTDGAYGERSFHFPFDATDLSLGWPTQQLRFAGLEHVKVLLTAFEITRNQRYLGAARDIINGWARYERQAWLPAGFLWNDHAIVERVLVLVRYWWLFRASPLYSDADGQTLLEFIGRSGRLLENAEHFTARTNHGVMQNLGLLHIAAAFPLLPDSPRFQSVAQARLRLQLGFYQSTEGVVLEHGPGYHALGVSLLEALVEYEDILGTDLGLGSRRRLADACRVLRAFMRPDGTLPLIGDTSATPSNIECQDGILGPGVATSGDTNGLRTYPVSGYAVGWFDDGNSSGSDARASQMVVAWGNFASRAHKHDDEMSIATWLEGRPVLTGTGYFAYGHSLQSVANSWRGANAPHFLWETSNARRATELLAAGEGAGVQALDLIRQTAMAGVWLRRQVLALGAGRWLILDYAEAPRRQSFTTVWTLFPGWHIDSTGAATFRAKDTVATGEMIASFGSPNVLTTRVLSSSASPFGGWVALQPAPDAVVTASSIEVIGQTGSPVASVWLSRRLKDRGTARIDTWQGPTDWSVCIGERDCDLRVARHGAVVEYSEGPVTQSVTLVSIPSQGSARQQIDGRYAAVSAMYPAWRDTRHWREKVTQLIVGLFVIQELLMLVSGRLLPLDRPRYQRRWKVLHAALVVVWLGFGAWVVFDYFGESWRFGRSPHSIPEASDRTTSNSRANTLK